LDPIDAEAARHLAGCISVLAGTPFKNDALIHGVTPFDISPTILTLLGQPYAEDSDGRPLLRAMVSGFPTPSIRSWEESIHLNDSAIAASDEAWQSAEHLIALGYVDRLAEQSVHTAEAFLASLLYRSQSLIEAGESARAVPLLTALVRLRPNRRQFRIDLFRAAMAVGDHASARIATEGVADAHGGSMLQLALASLCLAEQNPGQARNHLDRVALADCNADLLAIVGQTNARLRRHEQALQAFDAALALDVENEKAWFGRAKALRALGRLDAAWDAIRHTIAIRPEFARAHLELAALCRSAGKTDQALAAVRRALSIQPDLAVARRLLSRFQFQAAIGTK
jgi:tetratricopeptide (TPR) repeat protein